MAPLVGAALLIFWKEDSAFVCLRQVHRAKERIFDTIADSVVVVIFVVIISVIMCPIVDLRLRRRTVFRFRECVYQRFRHGIQRRCIQQRISFFSSIVHFFVIVCSSLTYRMQSLQISLIRVLPYRFYAY